MNFLILASEQTCEQMIVSCLIEAYATYVGGQDESDRISWESQKRVPQRREHEPDPIGLGKSLNFFGSQFPKVSCEETKAFT